MAATLWVFGFGAASGQDPLPPSAAADPFDYDQALAESGVDGGYGYFRTLDGSATLIQTEGERLQVEVNEPILVGDRVFISGGSRAELILADRNIIRLGDEADVGFRALAYSGDSNDAASVLDLRRGTMQLVVLRDQLGQDYPSVQTPNATVRVREAGLYLIVVDGEDRTEVVVRDGRADVLTGNDGAEVRSGESLLAHGRGTARLEFAAAPSLDRLEAWGDQLGQYQAGQYAAYVDDDLHYAASGLDDAGAWVDAGGSYVWRPYVSADWSPYTRGRWRYTPSGLFWVSYEPWGWVPYHYGYWDHLSPYGWVWYPGRRFAPAHVYWYWGQQYAGWVPIGYYARHYGRRYGSNFGFYFGVYGTIGGGWDPYRRWTFVEVGRFGHRRQNQFVLNGYDLSRRRGQLGRGILTTDTRVLRPDVWRNPSQGIARLTRGSESSGRGLRDANAFVQRAPQLPTDLERVTLRGGARGSARAGGAVRAGGDRQEALRPSVETRARSVEGRAAGVEGRAARPPSGAARERPTRATRADPQTGRVVPGANRQTGGVLRRPESTPRTLGRGSRQQSPAADRGGQAQRAAVRQPESRSGAGGSNGRELRRPSAPGTRPPAVDRATPRARTPATPPRVESRAAPAQRPTVRSSGGGSQRPTVRSSGGGSPRPTVRSSGGGSPRPTVRSSGGGSPRPTVRSSGGGSPRPTVRSSGGGSPRPTVRSSGGGSRPPVSRSSGSSGSSRSAPARSGRRGGGGG